MNEKGIIFLNFPMMSLDPGEVYESEIDNRSNLHDIGDINDIIENPANPKELLDLPGMTDHSVRIDVKGIVSVEKIGEANVSFLEGLLKFLKISTSAKMENYRLMTTDLKSITYTEIKTAKLQNRLSNFTIKNDFQSNLKYHYIGTRVYFCEGFEILYNIRDKKELEVIVSASNAADANFSLTNKSESMFELKSTTTNKIAFGISLATIGYDRLNNGKITITPLESSKAKKIKLVSLPTVQTENNVERFPRTVNLIDKRKTKSKVKDDTNN